MFARHQRITLAILFLLPAVSLAADNEHPIQFNRDIRPVLSNACFQCHGPDASKREADLRLDTEKGMFGDLGGYAAFVPGQPKKSEALVRILNHEMPPKRSNKKLTDNQIKLLQRWVEQGASWERHWAFTPPKLPKFPPTKKRDWVRSPLDVFVLARMEQAGLSPSREAEPSVLVRRLYLDLHGVPPAPEEADEWARRLGESETAYPALVDALLASPRYGERWARRWLDLARYADTNGYEKDRERSIWPYRDWVIDAINGDMPFDRFTIEQLAGDLLPNATLSQRIATGFHRNTMLNEEGGIDPLEYRFHAMTDRVGTTGTVWLGLTIGCAQCHDHKYDPISHREYYQFMAFLNNFDEPSLLLPDQSADALYRNNLNEAGKLLADLPKHWPGENREQGVQAAFENWLERERERTAEWTTLRAIKATSNLPLLSVEEDGSIFVTGDTTKQDVYEITFDAAPGDITAIRLEALPDHRLPANGPGTTYYEGTEGDFFLGELHAWADGRRVAFADASQSYAKNRFGSNPVSAKLALDGDPQTGWSVHGRQGERHVAVFVPEAPLAGGSTLRLKMFFGRHYASSLGRFRISVASSTRQAVARDLPASVESLLGMPEEDLSELQRKELWETFLLQAPQLEAHSKKVRELRRPPEYPRTLVLQERPKENPRPTHRHHRGEFLQPKEEVPPGIPAELHGLPDDLPQNRLGLARWLVSERNPLTARVTVNRHWGAFFGTGIVPTVGDFGFQGEPPTHPQLLDWLAMRFMEDGWSIKRLHRTIVTSAVYRQSSLVSPESARLDPNNTLLSRAPRFRLEAEVIRDSALHSAGLLTSRTGGPPVRPPQPEGVVEVAYGNPKWIADQGPDRYRRSIYTFQKRTAPFAMLSTFDAPSGEACIARRDVSNSPLQALTLLNDVTFVESARALGRTLASRDGGDRERAEYAFRRVLTRKPTEDELSLLVGFVQAQRERLMKGEVNARELTGEKTGNPIEHAAWTALARALFGLDETITRN